jgi:hypothetical protein
MKKLMVAAAVAAVASLSVASRVNAQAFYPGPTGAPAAGGTYGTYGGYPGTYGTYPSYPQQNPTASHRDRDRDDDNRYARNDRRDDDRRRSEYDRRDNYDRQSRSGYGTTSATSGVPSRVGNRESAAEARGRTTGNSRDARTGRDAWDRR